MMKPPPPDPYTNEADPEDHFTMTDAVRAGTRLIEAVHAFRDAYRALDTANGWHGEFANDNDNAGRQNRAA